MKKVITLLSLRLAGVAVADADSIAVVDAVTESVESGKKNRKENFRSVVEGDSMPVVKDVILDGSIHKESLLRRSESLLRRSRNLGSSEAGVEKLDIESGDGVMKLTFNRIQTTEKHVHIGIGDKLQIKLWGNPVTGDAWHLNMNPAPCLSGDGKANYASDDPQEPALGGKWSFEFETTQCCERVLNFRYGKAFPGESGVSGMEADGADGEGEKKIQVSVKVAPSLKSMTYKDGCSLKQEKEDTDDSWFV